MAAQMLAGGRASVERRRAPSEELEPERLGLVRQRVVVVERHAGVLRLDAGDPTPGAIEQLVLVVHEPSSGDEDAQVRPRVAVLAGSGDPQVEGFRLVGDRVPIGDTPAPS